MSEESLVYLTVATKRDSRDIGGWSPEEFGVAVAVILFPISGQVKVFEEENMAGLAALMETSKSVVGFNLFRFDLMVLRGAGGEQLGTEIFLDLMTDLERVLERRLSLESLMMGTFYESPALNSLDLVKLWKSGNWKSLIEECTKQVRAIQRLHEHGRDHGEVWVLDGDLRISIPVAWRAKDTRNEPLE